MKKKSSSHIVAEYTTRSQCLKTLLNSHRHHRRKTDHTQSSGAMEVPLHCDTPTMLTDDVIFEYWRKGAHNSIGDPCCIDETISAPRECVDPTGSKKDRSKQELQSNCFDGFEKLGCLKISSSSAFFLRNRLGCRVVLEIMKVSIQAPF